MSTKFKFLHHKKVAKSLILFSECDPCVHGLLDTTDVLQVMIDPTMEEMKDVSLSYFANKRLHNVNRTADTLRVSYFTNTILWC